MLQAQREIAGIVLAAGNSTRMGRPKQLLPFRGKTLLEHAIHSVQAAGCSGTLVVAGASLADIAGIVRASEAVLVENAGWKEGIASSIRAGIKAAIALQEDIPAVLLTLADQPLVTPTVLQRIVERFRAGYTLAAASEYAGQIGVPAIFSRALFPELISLSGSQGAKQVLLRHSSQVQRVPAPEAALDVDSPTDYDNLLATGS